MVEGAEDSNSISVSVVLPIHNERRNLAPLIAEIVDALTGHPVEIVAVDDGSDDDSGLELGRLRDEYPVLRVISHRRRAGQSAAIVTGCLHSRGTLIATLDGDGQNDPADLRPMLDVLEDHPGAAVLGYRVNRETGPWRRLQSTVANTVRNYITRDPVRDTGCSIRLVPREVMIALPRFDGMHRFLPTLIRRHGTPIVEVPVTDRPRRHGHSHYGALNRALRGWRDAWGVRWLLERRLDRQGHEEGGE